MDDCPGIALILTEIEHYCTENRVNCLPLNEYQNSSMT